ncbi:hypothetical protein HAZT_HAZT010169 [Hyalella azteca]|uniref:Forkhead box protein unc-130 n=1 Tax=Hyalella azteca TaxID=294128 RepID=A0A6A0GTR6_HYAAZ|nr:forkhead box protein unc-130 [Hyalella azteca]KAA0188263.1 hypothetical protein HAZT_HAZT010169 [Hyalella azteca]
MESVACVRSSSASPPTSVVAPVAVKAIISSQHQMSQQQQQQQMGQQQIAAVAAVEQQQRLHQLYQLALAERIRIAAANWPRPELHPPLHLPPIQGHVPLPQPHPAYHPLYPYRFMVDPRTLYRVPEEPKPQHSYIGLIAMAILSVPEKKLVLSEIYSYILEHYAYFRTRGPGWRNSIRHNLSLNDCFVKAGRSANGKGHYWAIHPANMDDFSRGDFRRRRAQRRVRRHMGLTVDDDSSPEPPPPTPPPISLPLPSAELHISSQLVVAPSRKRQFDVASLLAPDDHTEQVDQLLKSRRHSLKQEAPSTPTEESIKSESDYREETSSPNRLPRQSSNNNWLSWPWRPQELAQLESSPSN